MVYSPSSVNYSYTEPLNFLDDQQSFNNAFGNIPVMLLVSDRSSRAIEDSKTLRSKILDLCSLSHLHIFCDIIQLQYVGTATYDSKQMMLNISLSLQNLKLEFSFIANVITLTPDDLYQRYIQYLYLLLSDVMTWLFSIVTLFYRASHSIYIMQLPRTGINYLIFYF